MWVCNPKHDFKYYCYKAHWHTFLLVQFLIKSSLFEVARPFNMENACPFSYSHNFIKAKELPCKYKVTNSKLILTKSFELVK